MKFTINIDGATVILSQTQLEIIADALRDTEMVQSKYMGSGKGTNGNDYLSVLQPYDIRSQMVIRALPDPEYDALKFITANQSK